MSNKFDATSAVVRGRCIFALVAKTTVKSRPPVAANKASAIRKVMKTLSSMAVGYEFWQTSCRFAIEVEVFTGHSHKRR